MSIEQDHLMIEAARLTRAGRLLDATAMVQRWVAGAGRSDDAPAPKDVAPAGDRTTFFDQILQRIGFGGTSADAEVSTHTIPRDPDTVQVGDFIAGNYADAAGRRDYKLYIPAVYDGQPLPLIVMLHGCTQSPDDFAAGTRMNAVAEQHGCFVVYPAQPSSANLHKCWNWFNPQDQQRDHGEPALIAGITRKIMQDYTIDDRRVYVAGLSAGGAAAAVMGMAYPDLYAAVGVHSGLACGAATDMQSAFAAMRDGKAAPIRATTGPVVPTIVFHGDRDKTVNPSNGDQVIAQSKSGMPLGATVAAVTESGSGGGLSYDCTTHTDRSGETVFEQWVIHGASHAWSGGSAAGTYADPRGPDASREMVRFFLSHRR
jgi:poly(hydroxyalkanoate) depolymerase family esterase